MFPNYKDFQIAVYYTLGKALPKHIEEVQTEIIENFDIKYNSPMLAHPLLRTPIYEKIILRILDTMEDLKRSAFPTTVPMSSLPEGVNISWTSTRMK